MNYLLPASPAVLICLFIIMTAGMVIMAMAAYICIKDFIKFFTKETPTMSHSTEFHTMISPWEYYSAKANFAAGQGDASDAQLIRAFLHNGYFTRWVGDLRTELAAMED